MGIDHTVPGESARHAGALETALADIGKALGIDIPDFDADPHTIQPFADEVIAAIDASPERLTRPGDNAQSHAPAFTGQPDLDDPAVVAVLRLPIAVSHLLSISDLMEKVYGPGLMTPSPGRFFVLRRPETATVEENADARA